MRGTGTVSFTCTMAEIHIIPAVSLAGPVERATELSEKMRSLGISGIDPWSEAGRKALGFHFARMISRLPGIVAGVDPEEVHAMRVASRRMRAAWQVFGDGFERDPMRQHRQDLRVLGARLGVVRDLDVQLQILDTYIANRGLRARKALLPLWNAWTSERQERHRALVAFVAAPEFATFVTEAEAFLDVHAMGSAVAGRSSGPVRTRMPAKAWAAYGDIWAFEDRLAAAGPSDPTVLHELRIASKWLRYTLEFAREPIGGGVTLLIEPVVALQDHLGDQHDLHVAATLAREFTERDGGLTHARATHVHRFAADLEQRVNALGRQFPRAWLKVISPRYRDRLGRALVRL